MSGKVCVITGANTGIGEAVAVKLAALGAHVVMVCRNRERGERAKAEIDRAASDGQHAGSTELLIADLSSQAEVRAVAHQILAAHPAIDVLVNNAGVALKHRELTADTIERTFAVNYLAYFMLANLLLPALRAARRARIVNVASAAHGSAKLDFDNLQGERRYRNYPMYAASKLEDIMFTYALARRLESSGITVNTLHPGVVATEIWRQVPILNTLGKLFMISPEKGARTTVYLAASPDVEGVTGKYFDKCEPVKTIPLSHDVTLQEKLWDVSAVLTGVGKAV
jgi:NAD(P)-dependent dehydrogenase (short-subunit alcohol dehydrogenase family)